eukprot:TRINITY_DN6654_c0_g2_i1.p1 TRINITY_DN6654_c0_g2~~TRINITY_DN6654_c0_g2_i1.p1  ORF type:complete len:141 (+),score=32.09 TRINITY_DN6654_c0_g2_i1:121-543(+)
MEKIFYIKGKDKKNKCKWILEKKINKDIDNELKGLSDMTPQELNLFFHKHNLRDEAVSFVQDLELDGLGFILAFTDWDVILHIMEERTFPPQTYLTLFCFYNEIFLIRQIHSENFKDDEIPFWINQGFKNLSHYLEILGF